MDERTLQNQFMFIEPEEELELDNVIKEDKKSPEINEKSGISREMQKFIGKEYDYMVCFVKEIRAIFYVPENMNEEMEKFSAKKLIINTERGKEFAEFLKKEKLLLKAEESGNIAHFIKWVEEKDIQQEKRNREREIQAFDICQKNIKSLKLNMKLVKVHYLFDAARIMFYFTAPNKVDFRELVKQLASVFRTRIELRQIGVRDEAKLIGGIGPCGQHICCHRHLCGFKSVSIKMAKDQNLVLNPGKISGICGRLLCCLNYENSIYEEERKKLPEVEEFVEYESKKAKVISVNVLKHSMLLLFEDQSTKKANISEIKRLE